MGPELQGISAGNIKIKDLLSAKQEARVYELEPHSRKGPDGKADPKRQGCDQEKNSEGRETGHTCPRHTAHTCQEALDLASRIMVCMGGIRDSHIAAGNRNPSSL